MGIRRYTDPSAVFKIIICMRRGLETPASRDVLMKAVQVHLSVQRNVAEELLDKMLLDGFLKSNVKNEYIVADLRKVSNITIEDSVDRTFCFHQDYVRGSPDRDWYCFECHKAGEMIYCRQCTRVFHAGCIRMDMDLPILPLQEPVPARIKQIFDLMRLKTAYSPGELAAECCVRCRIKIRDKPQVDSDTGSDELNYLISLIFNNIKSWVRD